MSNEAGKLIETWRAIGPVAWAESQHGWITEDGKPVTLEAWQAAILGAWFANREEVTTLAISNIKKTGKTFLNAVITCWRWLCLPGQHFCVGNDRDQAEARQFAMIAEMVKRHPYLRTNCRVTKNELTFNPTGSHLNALAVDAAGDAGANHLTSSHTEAWGIIYEAGVRAWEELTTPPGRWYGMPALRIADSYAGFEGESKTWHSLVDRGLQGERLDDFWPIYKNGGLLLFHAEGEFARENCYRGSQKDAKVYYADQAISLRASAFTRFHENRRTAGESAFVTPDLWEACYSADVRPLAPGEPVKLTFAADASTSNDHTALVGTVRPLTTNFIDVRYCRVWEPVKIPGIRRGKLTVDLENTIIAEVLRLHESKQVARVVCDPFQLHQAVLTWTRAGIEVVEMGQGPARVDSDQSLYNAILGRSLRHYSDPKLNQAVLNAIAVETARGYRLAKEKASKKIDACVALSMSHFYALTDAVYHPLPNQRQLEQRSRWQIGTVEIDRRYPGTHVDGVYEPGWHNKFYG